jgi:hypothetical protein
MTLKNIVKTTVKDERMSILHDHMHTAREFLEVLHFSVVFASSA